MSSTLSFAGWWVLSRCSQQTPKVHHSLTVELHCLNGSPTNWGQANEDREILVPPKVFMPMVLPWMIKRHDFTTDRVNKRLASVFLAVAARTSESKIIQRRIAASTDWDDVIDVKRLRCVFHLT